MSKQFLSFAQLAGQFQRVKVGTLLWLRLSKTNKQGTAPIQLRIFIGNDRIEHSTGLRTTPEEWDAPNGRILGKGKAVQQQNEQLQLLKAHVPQLVNLMKATGRKVTISSLRRELKAPTAGESRCFITVCQQATASRDKCKPSTQLIAASAIGVLIDWHGRYKDGTHKPLLVEEFTPRQAAEFYHWLLAVRQVKASSARTYVSSLAGLFRYAAELGEVEISDNPFRALRKLKGAPAAARLHLTREQIELLRTATGLPRAEAAARDVYLTQYYLHGSRVGAVLQLTWQDVAHDTVRLQMEKGGPLKAVSLCPPLREVLQRQAAGATWVFASLLGADYAKQNADEQFSSRKKAVSCLNMGLQRLAKRLGIEGRLHSHTARHTLAAHAAELGGLEVAQGMLGHATAAMTAHYAGPQRSAALAAVEQALYGGGAEPAPTSEPPAPSEGGKVLPLWKGGAAA